MSLIDDITRDRTRPQVEEKSLPHWVVERSGVPGVVYVTGPSFKVTVITTATDLSGEDYIARHADARRIARVPDMESRILSDATRIASLEAQLEEMAGVLEALIVQVSDADLPFPRDAETALTAYRKSKETGDAK